MARIEASILVHQPLEQVFAFLNAAENHARFIPNMAKFQQTSPGSFGQVGATAHGLLSYFGLLKISVRYELSAHEMDRRLAMTGQMGPVRFKDGYILEKKSKGTEIKFWLELTLTGWTKIFSPFVGLIGRLHAWETLRNLRKELIKKEIALSRRWSATPRNDKSHGD